MLTDPLAGTVALCGGGFGTGFGWSVRCVSRSGWRLFFNPPYGFSPEELPQYRTMCACTQGCSSRASISASPGSARPAADEISRTYLGYVARPLLVKIDDFTVQEAAGAAQERSRFDVALVLDQVRAARPLFERWQRLGNRIKTRFLRFHRDGRRPSRRRFWGGRVVFTEKERGWW